MLSICRPEGIKQERIESFLRKKKNSPLIMIENINHQTDHSFFNYRNATIKNPLIIESV